VLLARHAKRPHSLDYIERLFTDFQEIHGDRNFGDDAAIVAGLAHFEGRPVMVVAEQKGRDTKQKLYRNFGMPKPEGYRKALRIMQLAGKFGRPIVTFLILPAPTPASTPKNAAKPRPSPAIYGKWRAFRCPCWWFASARAAAAGRWRWASAISC
jgi:acetyl-CoA carboxylase alpha subunit